MTPLSNLKASAVLKMQTTDMIGCLQKKKGLVANMRVLILIYTSCEVSIPAAIGVVSNDSIFWLNLRLSLDCAVGLVHPIH